MGTTIVVPLLPAAQNDKHVSERALPVAQALARQLGAQLALLTVLELPRDETPDAERLAYEVARQNLERVAGAIDDIGVSLSIRTGEPADEIVAAAAGFEQPCIVMSSHARTGLRRMLVGSVAFKVVHDSCCPVIVVPANCPLAADWGPGRILVPLDGLAYAECAMDAVIELFGTDVDLHLLVVVEPLIQRSGWVTRHYYGIARDATNHYLDEVAQRLIGHGCRVTREIRVGIPEEEIANAARACGASLIALATHGRAGLGRLVIGSTAEYLAHEDRIPLLLVRTRIGILPHALVAEAPQLQPGATTEPGTTQRLLAPARQE
jgi:nucleotide-binding universal stress UspA family protein